MAEELNLMKSEPILPPSLSNSDNGRESPAGKRSNPQQPLLSKRQKHVNHLKDDIGCKEHSRHDEKPDEAHAVVLAQNFPTGHDILLASRFGVDYRQYAGNMKLDTLVREKGRLYSGATYKEKCELVTQIAQQVKAWDPPGRFLKLDDESNQWIEVPEQYAELHVLQLLIRHSPTQYSGVKPSIHAAKAPREPEQLAGIEQDTRKAPDAVASRIGGADVSSPPTARAKSPSPFEPTVLKHLHRAALQPEMMKTPRADFSEVSNPQATDGDQNHFSFLDAGRAKDFASFPEVDEFGCIKEQNERCFELSKTREKYDEAVIEVALYNYECFYGLKHGTASFGLVLATSAGITGWAASVIQKKQPAPNLKVACESEKKPQEKKTRRDPEEDRQLQMALLESIGAFPGRSKLAYDDQYLSSNEYAYDSYSEGGWSDEEEGADEDEKDDTQDLEHEGAEPTARLALQEKEEGSDEGCDKAGLLNQSSRRTIVRSSWQFQQLMTQVRESAGSRPTKGDDKPSKVANLANLQKSDCDDASWSHVSSGSDSTGSAVVLDRDAVEREASQEELREEWEYVEEAGVARSRQDTDDDWSDVSCGGC